LLAPASGRDAVAAVLSAGADAVYVGVRGFSRDGRAAGMDLAEIEAAASLCARAGAPLEAALNTVPAAAEAQRFVDAAARLRDAGAAAVILNDPGLIALVRARVPGIGICASVGLKVANPWDARALRELGADRVVLPAGLRAEEVPPIRSAGVAVEVFLVCRPEPLFHGTCALPGYALAPRVPAERPDLARAGGSHSAKRAGRCDLACRGTLPPAAPWSAEEDLVAWIRAGTDAFKIQGRGLPARPLADLVARLRRRLDAAIAAAGP